MIKYILLINLCFLLVCPLSSAHAESLTLNYNELASYVRSKNRKVLSKNDLVNSQKAKTKHLTKSFLPRIDASAGIEKFKTGTVNSRGEPYFKVSSKINIFRSGKDVLENKIQNNKFQISKLNLKSEFLNQLTTARYLYVSANYYKNQIRSFKNILYDLNNLLKQSKSKLQSGLISTSEISAIELYVDEIHTELLLTEEEREHNIDELKTTLGLPHATSLKLNSITRHQHLSFQNKNVLGHPSLATLKKQKSIANQESKKSARWWLPSVDAYGNYGLYTYRKKEYENHKDRDEYVVGLELNIPIFDKLKASSNSVAEKFKSQSLNNESHYLKQELESHFSKLSHGLKLRHKLLHRSKNTLGLARSHLNKLKEEFQNGIKNGTDIISGYETLQLKNQKYNEHLKEYFVLEASLLALTSTE